MFLDYNFPLNGSCALGEMLSTGFLTMQTKNVYALIPIQDTAFSDLDTKSVNSDSRHV